MSAIRPLRDMGGGSYGHKARNLRWLFDEGEPIPATWLIPAGAKPSEQEIARFFDGSKRYAVRSSADVEDGALLSFAGQFTSRLDVEGLAAIRDAITDVQLSVSSETVRAYLVHAGAPDKSIQMGVVVQEMVQPVASGVVFSRNPITGLNEVVIEAVAGRGDRLLSEGVTPDRWIHRWGTWTEKPESPVVPDAVAGGIAAAARRIAEEYGKPADLEWVWDGDQVWWVQLRPITGIDDVVVYSNRIAKEVMPGIIKPLVWSVNVPVVNTAWIELFTEAIGPNDLEPDALARSFAYRSYFNMSAVGDIFELFGMPRDSLELLLGLDGGDGGPSMRPTAATLRKLPRLLNVALGNVRYAKKVPGYLDRLERRYEPYASRALRPLSEGELLRDVDELMPLTTAAALINIKVPLLANLRSALLRRKVANAGFDPEDVAITSVTDLGNINPQAALEKLGAVAAKLDDDARTRITERGLAAAPDHFRNQVLDFLDTFGHFSASGNDFSVAPWRESPDTIARLALNMPANGSTRGSTDWEAVEASQPLLKRLRLRSAQRRTAHLIQLRESVSSVYTFGYGVFRRYFLELGRRLTERGLLDDRNDIWYLTLEEVRQAVHLGLAEAGEIAAQRKREIDQLAGVDMPDIIYGDDFVPAARSSEVASQLSGVPTSRGRYRGRLRIVRELADFPTVEQGDVIAVPFSDVGWTPVFARAGAVVAESGGMLSHASIVAREYGIPCVVSVPGATRLPEGATVIVDAYAGTVTVE